MVDIFLNIPDQNILDFSNIIMEVADFNDSSEYSVDKSSFHQNMSDQIVENLNIENMTFDRSSMVTNLSELNEYGFALFELNLLGQIRNENLIDYYFENSSNTLVL